MIINSLIHNYINTSEFAELSKAVNNKDREIYVEGVSPSSFPLLIGALFQQSPKQIFVVMETIQKAQEFSMDLSCYIDENDIVLLPPWETLPYEFVSPTEYIERTRITSLYRLLKGDPVICVSTVESLMRKIPHKDFFLKKGFTLEINEEYPFDDIIELLVNYGYSREYRVDAFGHFSVKGGIIDVFLPSINNPVRLEFFGDTLESIREFDLGSQISGKSIDSIIIYPRKELILLNKEKQALVEHLTKAYEESLELSDEIIEGLESGALSDFKGVEDLFPLVIDTSTILSFLQEDAEIIYIEPQDLVTKKNNLENVFLELYNRKKSQTFCLEPVKLIDLDSFDMLDTKAIHMQVYTTTDKACNAQIKSIQNFHGKIKHVREELAERVNENWNITITTSFEGQARRLFDLLQEFDPHSDFNTYSSDATVNILITPLSQGMEIHALKTYLLTDHEIFGKSYRKKKTFKKKTSRPIDSFLDLNENDYVVHINHGIGIFRGIERMSAGGVERDFLMIEYNEGDKLYVSLDQINMVQKYIGVEGRKPRIDNLGKKSAWNRIKEKVQKAVEELAKDLIEIYSKRNALKGYQFPSDTLWQEEFESQFEYEETPDQITAIEDVKDDMEKIRPMDRLICGDVGFGKTEVVIRASFKSVMAGKQVAILVPTTVLAMQHFSTFNKRFADYPVEVDMMSRFRTTGELKKIKAKLSEGQIDIIIGTHALLSKELSIKNLGLLIIDEEQRFGVKHKEQLKRFRSQVDVLTLSATPIPRTLHMSMAGIRDLSIIMTPPENRQSVETYVLEENPDILKMAIKRELDRDGQIFFVHNRVQTIDAHAAALQKLVPEASCCVAHGQMAEDELETIMIDFMKKKYDVLISTTIIESGLDIPNVNTIIINRADTFGLSQLYQLKGRVGRSNRKAYAYLFYPRHASLTEEAQKRLRVISEYSELGSGFKIAMKDLEIRGAGNLLGKEQSGTIMEVGFDLYTKMLEDSVNRLKGENVSSLYRCPVYFKTDFYIPDEYIGDRRQKIEFYKRYEACNEIEEVVAVEGEMIDRFGKPPSRVTILIEHEKIRTIASNLLIEEILEDSQSIRIKITNDSKIDRTKIIEEISKNRQLSIDKENPEVLLFKADSKESDVKLMELKEWLQQFT